jgi:hypothetical protein
LWNRTASCGLALCAVMTPVQQAGLVLGPAENAVLVQVIAHRAAYHGVAVRSYAMAALVPRRAARKAVWRAKAPATLAPACSARHGPSGWSGVVCTLGEIRGENPPGPRRFDA